MKALLSLCTLRRSIGLVIDDQRVAVSVVLTTPLGRKLVFSEVLACDGERAQDVLKRLLDPWTKQARGKKAKLGPWVQLAVPESQVFQAAVPITHANLNATPQSAYFLEAVQATNVRAEDRIIDLIKIELNKQPIACVAAAFPRDDQRLDRVDGLAGNPGRTGRAGPRRGSIASVPLPKGAGHLKADCAVLSRPAASNRGAGRGYAAPFLAHLRFTTRRGVDHDPGRQHDPLDAGAA